MREVFQGARQLHSAGCETAGSSATLVVTTLATLAHAVAYLRFPRYLGHDFTFCTYLLPLPVLHFALAVMNCSDTQFHVQSSLLRHEERTEDCISSWRHAQWLTRQTALLLALVRALVHEDGNSSI